MGLWTVKNPMFNHWNNVDNTICLQAKNQHKLQKIYKSKRKWWYAIIKQLIEQVISCNEYSQEFLIRMLNGILQILLMILRFVSARMKTTLAIIRSASSNLNKWLRVHSGSPVHWHYSGTGSVSISRLIPGGWISSLQRSVSLAVSTTFIYSHTNHSKHPDRKYIKIYIYIYMYIKYLSYIHLCKYKIRALILMIKKSIPT